MSIKNRYISLDVLRGLTIALMIMVNTPGDWNNIYAQFEHSVWHGFTITDLVFPTFLFVVGNAMSFSIKKIQDRDSTYLLKLFKRSFIIFIIGLALNAFPFFYRAESGNWEIINFWDVRFFGVLQRIAFCYLTAGLLVKYLNVRNISIIGGFLLLLYWGLMYFFGDSVDPYSLTGNASLKLDLAIFRPENLYHGFGIPFDPEGFLSTIPAIVNVLAGYLVGLYIQKTKNRSKAFYALLVMGLVALILAQVWDIWFPINKPIWTSSYVIYSTGWDLVVLSMLILFIEILNFKKWIYFFIVFGRNPLFIYILSGIIIGLFDLIHINGESLQMIIYDNLFLSWLDPINASLLFAVFYMLLLWLIALIMDRKQIYIKV